MPVKIVPCPLRCAEGKAVGAECGERCLFPEGHQRTRCFCPVHTKKILKPEDHELIIAYMLRDVKGPAREILVPFCALELAKIEPAIQLIIENYINHLVR